MKLFALGKVKQIVEEALGLDISYAYDDLVFVEHSALLIVFDKEDLDSFKCYFNTDCPDDDRNDIFSRIETASIRNKMKSQRGGSFSLSQKDGEEIEIRYS